MLNSFATPASVVAGNMTQTAATLTWNAVSGVTSYIAFINGQVAATLAADTTSYDYTGLTAGTGYTLAVVAVNAGGSSSAAEAIIITVAAAPTVTSITSGLPLAGWFFTDAYGSATWKSTSPLLIISNSTYQFGATGWSADLGYLDKESIANYYVSLGWTRTGDVLNANLSMGRKSIIDFTNPYEMKDIVKTYTGNIESSVSYYLIDSTGTAQAW